MDYDLEGCENLDYAQSLLVKSKTAESDSEIRDLIFKSENLIKELFSSSYPGQPNPSMYKTLNAALTILNDKNQRNSNTNKFSFKSLRGKPVKFSEPKADEPQEPTHSPLGRPELVYDENCIIKNINDKRIFRFLNSGKLGYVNIENAQNSDIILINVADSSFIYNVKNCIIWLSIANSSVMLDNVSDSVIITCSRQLRVSNSKNVKFFTNTVTPPIIEMSKNLSFSTNHLTYEGFEDHLKMSDLSGDFLESQDSIKDFSWHHPQKSPNWETMEAKPEHTITICTSDDENELNFQSFSEFDWQILKTL
ncbi:uncharacterized protein TOT_010001134 [Theileria orientalis strain Shintoku]|uniref:C-CAP/cofactor C-like domain-containing protein n=1 Tax=Theileria orientalis strain Shintoku TaxID=869250 RepID=J4D6N1_THEOR|nr:uncharacterized protein TOT_010001134 [Theileria orientalis strain Shintoku]PVC52448.1 hypothetical protein MACL_00000764 [Theileria orientalis]BAM39680.1 uncharacterized protein TOT_010001134 [Theileria orientalis strain Shintoku]|eukprot:XP_009689981.1 uncharacterized protein TOT_010001134 [Theileria orientalis strain Shintoku]